MPEDRPTCSCGREAACLDARTKEPVCYEVVCDSKEKWQAKYDDKKPRHRKER
jgi:hypothetical protein